MTQADPANFEVFRECVSEHLIKHFSDSGTKSSKKKTSKRSKSISVNQSTSEQESSQNYPLVHRDLAKENIEELADFISYLAEELFDALPSELRAISFVSVRNNAPVSEKYSLPLSLGLLEELAARVPASTLDSLTSYAILKDESTDVPKFLRPILEAYIASTTAPPPSLPEAAVKASACEICARDWIPLTYHHLIPKGVHAKVLKRGWHEDWRLNSVAWLCRACHSMVHGIASNEELARELYSVDLLLEREDVQKWAHWVGRVRWKAR